MLQFDSTERQYTLYRMAGSADALTKPKISLCTGWKDKVLSMNDEGTKYLVQLNAISDQYGIDTQELI